MKRPLQEIAKTLFKKFSLSEDQFKVLEEMQEEVVPQKKWRRPFSWAMVFVLIAGVSIGYLWKNHPASLNLSKLPQEIVYHHNKKIEPEIQTNSISELRSFLTKLDFNLVESKFLPSNEWELLGGRYCSLQGRLAAQIKIRNKTSQKIYTLYQLAIPEHLKSMDRAFENYVDGVKVKIWREQGLLFGIAGEE